VTPERIAIKRGWFYVVEPERGNYAPQSARLLAGDGGVLTRRLHGHRSRVWVRDESQADLHRATWVRAASAVGRGLEALGHLESTAVVLGPAGVQEGWRGHELVLDGPAVASAVSHHSVEARIAGLLGVPRRWSAAGDLPDVPTPRVLFFESLMNSELPHNDRELSQGVLHMAAPLRGTGTEVVLANVKMSITGVERPVSGLDDLDRVLSGDPIGLVVITLLEGYFEGVQALVRCLRDRGCRAHVAVGGVMPTLAPEHVAAHLADVSFVCRGAGEVHLARLAEILGPCSVDQGFSDAQRAAFLSMDGLIAFDPAGGLIAGNCAAVPQVEALDRVALDLSHLQPRHIQGGIEIATSRGCLHKCTFCSIMGRESYQARSAGGIFELLRDYEQRFEALYGDEVPPNAWRVHICDDDFACERDRAIAFFRSLRETPFRLSSVQVSVADLCVRDGGRLLPVPDADLFEAMDPACFADFGRSFPVRDHVADFGSRTWSAYLQLGVESFSDRELARMGKGYRVEHIRAIAAEFGRRALHWDAYFILSNADTSAGDLIDVLEELARLKLRYPIYFHVRFPVVPRLVSYFTAASYRRHQRQGRVGVCSLRGMAQVPQHGELDYPFVAHDDPEDPWVRAALPVGDGPTFFTDEGRYTGSMVRLRSIWAERLVRLSGEERLIGEALVRRLDDAPRRLAFEALRDAREGERTLGGGVPGWPGHRPDSGGALATVREILGPSEQWLRGFERFCHQASPRLVVIPTWQCELRCRYCYIPKQDGRVMSGHTLDRAVELLLSSHRQELILQFFGGEALMEWDLVRGGIERGAARAQTLGKDLTFILSTNGYSLDAEKLAWLRGRPVKLELSLDGTPETQNRFRRAHTKGMDSYEQGIAPRAAEIVACGLPYDVIMVVHPQNVNRITENFFHIASLGFRRIQVNFALGSMWTADQQRSYAKGLFEIGRSLRSRWAQGDDLVFVNLEGRPMPIRLNGEVTVDWDGTLYGGNAFLHETEHKERFRLGHLDDLGGFDRYWLDGPTNETLLAWSYPDRVTANNLKVGAIFTSFHRWMQTESAAPERKKV
jgi:uncharacterized Fe-S cluster-containing radical SAM superfamily protein